VNECRRLNHGLDRGRWGATKVTDALKGVADARARRAGRSS
jgi:hypothetical protein